MTPERVLLEAGRSCDVLVEVRGPRMILGAELDRPVTVTATATVDGEPSADPTADAAGRPGDADCRNLTTRTPAPHRRPLVLLLRQRPWITRGMLTALILLAIIALWAAVFLFGLREVFSADPPTKIAPVSFFIATDIAPAAYTGVDRRSGPRPECCPRTAA